MGDDHVGGEDAADPPVASRTSDMTITGKLNAEEDTIFLKVQIADETGTLINCSSDMLHCIIS